MSILVDSSVWIDYFNGRVTWETDYLDQAVATTRLYIGDLILTELLQGFRQQSDFEEARAALERFSILSLVGKDNAILAAQNYRTLRRQGITIRNTIDCLIATWCIANEFTLLHADRDFLPFEEYLGLTAFHPAG